jgi:hypothetical protein
MASSGPDLEEVDMRILKEVERTNVTPIYKYVNHPVS